MVHEMCSTISHAVGKLVTGIGRIDDAQEGTSRSEAVHAEKSRQQPTRRSKQVPAARDSLSSEEESFKTDSEEDASDMTKLTGIEGIMRVIVTTTQAMMMVTTLWLKMLDATTMRREKQLFRRGDQ